MFRARLQPSLAPLCRNRVPLRPLHVHAFRQQAPRQCATAVRSNFPRHIPVLYSFALAVPTANSPTPKTATRAIRHATPSEIEAAGVEPSSSSIVQFLQRLISALDEWIVEPLLTVRRLAHIFILFAPVLLTVPITFFGKHVPKEGERSGTLWWYDFLAAQMERAGPTFIKLAQWIASRTDLFPLALCSRLSKLHSQVDPHPFSYTCRVLKDAFKRDLSEIFTELDETPLGVGAIAQVYKAKVRPHILVKYLQKELIVQDNVITPDCVQTLDEDGNVISMHTSVAIKVLHPKARQIVNRDLKIMNFFAKALTLIPTIHWLSLPQEVQVFGDMMRDQLDLRIEASHLERFNELFAGSKQVKFPRPLAAFSTKDMLMEEYEHGIPLNIFLEQAAYAKKRGEPRGVFDHKIANIGLDAFLHMLISYNFVHADLHPGNIMVKFYKPSAYHPLQRAWARMLGRYLRDDGDAVVRRVLAVADDPEEMRKELEKVDNEGYVPRLVFIDTGLVNELNDVNRRNFLDLFQAIAEFDGYRAGELMVERCRSPEMVVNPDVFALRMQNLILALKQKTFNLGAVKIGNLLHDAMNMVRAHHVKLEGDFVNVVVSIMLLEGIGRQLDPNLDLFKSALPVLREYSIKDRGKATIEGMKDVQQRGSTPHWIKVWIFLELRNWFSRSERDDPWLQMCDILCPNNQ